LAEERTTEDDRKLIMEARHKAAEKMKKLSHTKTDSVETNSMEEGDGEKDSPTKV
jgi:predicted nucleotidyltransferase